MCARLQNWPKWTSTSQECVFSTSCALALLLSLPPEMTDNTDRLNRYYNAVILVDLFQFTNSYTVLPDIAEIAHATEEDEEDQGADLRSECENYVFSSTSRASLPETPSPRSRRTAN